MTIAQDKNRFPKDMKGARSRYEKIPWSLPKSQKQNISGLSSVVDDLHFSVPYLMRLQCACQPRAQPAPAMAMNTWSNRASQIFPMRFDTQMLRMCFSSFWIWTKPVSYLPSHMESPSTKGINSNRAKKPRFLMTFSESLKSATIEASLTPEFPSYVS